MNFMPPPLRCLSIVGLCLALAACDTPPTLVDQHFGLAVQRAQAQQSLLAPSAQAPMASHCSPERPGPHCPNPHMRPGGGMGQGMHSGMGHSMGSGTGHGAGQHAASTAHDRLSTSPDTDGASAMAATMLYQQSFQAPPAPAPVFNIGLGAVRVP